MASAIIEAFAENPMRDIDSRVGHNDSRTHGREVHRANRHRQQRGAGGDRGLSLERVEGERRSSCDEHSEDDCRAGDRQVPLDMPFGEQRLHAREVHEADAESDNGAADNDLPSRAACALRETERGRKHRDE
jgi:hypothetical protein